MSSTINPMAAKKAKLPEGETPEAPPMTAEAGDKTPEYVEWFLKYHPEEFEARYGKRQGTNITSKLN